MAIASTIETRLDAELAHIREEIARLRKEKSQLSIAILSSDNVQHHLRQRRIAPRPSSAVQTGNLPIERVVASQSLQNRANIHRLAYGVTSFPFTDPTHLSRSESENHPPLLGVRFDLPTRNGRADEAPYYIVLKRLNPRIRDSNVDLTVKPHLEIAHHTIPNHIDIATISRRFLRRTWDPYKDIDSDVDAELMDLDVENEPRTGDEMSWQDDSGVDVTLDLQHTVVDHAPTKGQDLHGFVAAVRTDLMAWWNRVQTVHWLEERLQVLPNEQDRPTIGHYHISKLTCGTADARKIQLAWTNGNTGLLRVSNEGEIELAVVCRVDDSRVHQVEQILCYDENGRKVHLDQLGQRLKICDKTMFGDIHPAM